MECVIDHVVANALDLHVKLNRRDSVLSPGDLEVHVAHVVFLALNVGEGDVLPTFSGNQANGDASYRGLDRHACIHQSEGASAYGSH